MFNGFCWSNNMDSFHFLFFQNSGSFKITYKVTKYVTLKWTHLWVWQSILSATEHHKITRIVTANVWPLLFRLEFMWPIVFSYSSSCFYTLFSVPETIITVYTTSFRNISTPAWNHFHQEEGNQMSAPTQILLFPSYTLPPLHWSTGCQAVPHKFHLACCLDNGHHNNTPLQLLKTTQI